MPPQMRSRALLAYFMRRRVGCEGVIWVRNLRAVAMARRKGAMGVIRLWLLKKEPKQEFRRVFAILSEIQ